MSHRHALPGWTLMVFAWMIFASPALASYSVGDKERGYASWYREGSTTASGESFDRHKLTAAHRSLPFGTLVRVTSRTTGRSVEVRINDRGPYQKGRIIDVSEAAADALKMKQDGMIPVEIKVLHLGNGAVKKKHKEWWKFW